MVDIIHRDGVIVGLADDGKAAAWIARNNPTGGPSYVIDDSADEVDCHDVAPLIARMADRMAVTLQAVFIPYSASRNAAPRHGSDKPWPSVNWRVTLLHKGRPFLLCDYSQGTAYAPAHKAKARMRDGDASLGERLRKRAIGHEIERGTVHQFGDGPFTDNDGTKDTRKPIPAPDIGDVLQSLARDSDVLDSRGFEDWAGDLGYSTDSREAESIYRESLDQSLKLRNTIGGDNLAELRLAASFN